MWLIFTAIVLTIALSFVTNINAGLFGMAFSYAIGTFVLGNTPISIINMWPIRITFMLFALSLFYSFATTNGTLEKIAAKTLWLFRKAPQLWPVAIAIVAFCIGVLGSGSYATIAMLSPIGYYLSKKTNMNPIIGQVAVIYASAASAEFFITAQGAIVRGLIYDSGYQEQATAYSLYVMLGAILLAVWYILASILILGRKKAAGVALDLQAPEPFDDKQKKTAILIAIFVTLMVLPYFLSTLMPSNEIFLMFVSYTDVGFIAIILSIVAIVLKLGDQKTALSNVSWNIIILVSGVSMLVSIASKLGVIDKLTQMVGASESKVAVAIMIAGIAGVMSVFSSTIGVVVPTLYPIVKGLAATSGLSPVYLFIIILVGSLSTGISPVSTTGGLSLGCCQENETANYMFKAFCVFPVIGCLSVLGIIGIITAFL
jgi:di/tricarboxylate transporter